MRKPGSHGTALVAGLLAAAFAAACASSPARDGGRPAFVSEEEELRIGVSAYGPAVRDSLGRSTDPRLQAWVGTVGGKLAAVSSRPGLPWEFTVVNATYEHAFGLPGGKVALTRALLARLFTEDQLAGVLAHEIAHVTSRHGARATKPEAPDRRLLAGGADALAAFGAKGGEGLAALCGIGARPAVPRYSPEEEREADEVGMDLLAKAGYDPDGLVEVLEILAKARETEPSRLAAMLQGHPFGPGRIRSARRLVATAYAAERERPATADAFTKRTRRLKAEAPAFAVADEAEAAFATTDYRRAAVKYAEASRLAPLQAVLPALEAMALLAAGEDPGARGRAHAAVGLDPDLFVGRLAAGLASWRLQQWREAVDELTGAETSAGAPLLPTAYVIGRSYESLGEAEKAAERYRFVVKNGGGGEAARDAEKRLRAAGQAPAPAP